MNYIRTTINSPKHSLESTEIQLETAQARIKELEKSGNELLKAANRLKECATIKGEPLSAESMWNDINVAYSNFTKALEGK